MRLPVFVLCALLLAPSLSADPLALESDGVLYDDLEHFRALGLWRGGLEMRPLGRDDFARALQAIEEGAAGGKLGSRDARRLERLRRAARRWGLTRPVGVEDVLARELALRASGSLPPSRWEPWAGLQFLGGPSGLDWHQDLDRRPHDESLIFLGLEARIGERLGAQWRYRTDYSRHSSLPADGWMDNLPRSARRTFTDATSRNDRAVLCWAGQGWSLRLGREDRRMGQGRRGTLFLGENAFPMDGASFSFRSRYVSGVSLLAQTQRGPQPDADPAEPAYDGSAYMAAHRIELHPGGRWSLAVFEAVAWGGRGLDLAYANPLGFLVAITQDIYDRSGTDDKKVLGADLRLDLAPVTLYGELLLDRLVTLDAAADGDESDISSWGQLVGLRWADPLGWDGMDLDLEYAHLDPQVYFHHDQDPRRHLLSEGELLGHWLGPNADGFYAALSLPAAGGRLRLDFEQCRWGLLDGLTGLEAGFTDMTRGEKRWLTGQLASERMLGLHWERAWREDSPVRMDTRLSVARVARGGEWSGGGWLLELELKARIGRLFEEGVW